MDERDVEEAPGPAALLEEVRYREPRLGVGGHEPLVGRRYCRRNLLWLQELVGAGDGRAIEGFVDENTEAPRVGSVYGLAERYRQRLDEA